MCRRVVCGAFFSVMKKPFRGVTIFYFENFFVKIFYRQILYIYSFMQFLRLSAGSCVSGCGRIHGQRYGLRYC